MSRYSGPSGTASSGGAVITAAADYTFPYLKTTAGVIHPGILDALSKGRLAVGDVIQWAAYWQGSDLGGGTGRIVAAGTGTDDGGSYITTGSYQIEQVFGGVVEAAQFGIAGDGIADDTAKLVALFNTGMSVDLGFGRIRFTSPITLGVNSDVHWFGSAILEFDSASHSEHAIRLSDSAGNHLIRLEDLTIDGNSMANMPLFVRNLTDNSSPSTLIASRVTITNAERSDAFVGGDLMRVQGAFASVSLDDCALSGAVLPAGQGTPGSTGVIGLGVFAIGAAYVERVNLSRTTISDVMSADLSYPHDQDGVIYLTPDDVAAGKLESEIVVTGCRFDNCGGRSIKTQCRTTVVKSSHFRRTAGVASPTMPEIGVQTGSLTVSDNSFSYRGHAPNAVVSGQGFSQSWKCGGAVTGNEVSIADGAVLPAFFTTWTGGVTESYSRFTVDGNQVHGPVTRFADLKCSGTKNYFSIRENWADDVPLDSTTSGRAFVYVSAATASPYHAFLEITGNVFDGAETVALVRDTIPGSGMRASYSGFGNQGFLAAGTESTSDADSGLASLALAARLTGFEDDVTLKGALGMQTQRVSAGAIATFQFRNSNASMILLQVSKGRNDFAIFSVDSSIAPGVAGTGVVVGTTTEPGSGDFRVWCSGAGELSVRNSTTASREVSLLVFAPN